MNDVMQVLLSNLDSAYASKGWHGTTLRGSLRGVTAKSALRRPGKGRHDIYELAVHAAYWKYVVRRRLHGDRRGSFALKGSNWFPSPDRLDDAAWKRIVRLLEDEHRLLRQTIESLTDAELRDPKTQRLIYGVAAHDLYHTGQIQLIKKLV